jgi:hypothetical protein
MLKIFLVFFILLQAVYSLDHSYKTYDSILKKYVSNGKVDYKNLKNDSNFETVLKEFSSVTQAEYNNFSKEQKLSFLINSYNAFTLKLINDNYPIKSIRKIGLLPLAAWREEFFVLLDKKRSLGWIEHEKLRKDFSEPRIHFTIVCASIGCPVLINSAFTPDKLEKQFQETKDSFLKDSSKNRYDKEKNTLYISEIFKWFEDDFTKKGTLIQFLQPSFSETIDKKAKIEYTYYDWNLNEK